MTVADALKHSEEMRETKSELAIHAAFWLAGLIVVGVLLPRPTFHLGSSLRAHAWQMLGGLALFTSGLWILGWSLRRIRIGIEQQGSSCIAS